LVLGALLLWGVTLVVTGRQTGLGVVFLLVFVADLGWSVRRFAKRSAKPSY
jgi:hypothetical protein